MILRHSHKRRRLGTYDVYDQRGERTPKTVTGHGITHVKPCPVHRTNLTSIAGRPKPPLSYLRKSHPHAWNNHPESTTPMEPKHDQSVEIHEKSPDMNLVISYDENLEINKCREVTNAIGWRVGLFYSSRTVFILGSPLGNQPIKTFREPIPSDALDAASSSITE